MAHKLGTDPRMTRSGLSLVAEHYRDVLAGTSHADEFERRRAAVWEDLQAGERQGRDAAFCLHVLVNVRFPRAVRLTGVEAARRLTRAQRGHLLRGARTLRALGLRWVSDVIGPDPAVAQTFLQQVEVLVRALETGVALDLPSARLGQYRRRLTARQTAERLLDSALVCLMDALQGTPKAVETVTVWVEQFGVLPAQPRRGGSPTAYVKKRAQRARARVRRPGATPSELYDTLTPTGYVADLLTRSYADLKAHLLLSAGMRDGSLWAAQAQQWGTTEADIQRACRAFCRDRSFLPEDPAGVEVFQETLEGLARQEGRPVVAAFVARWAGRAPSPPTPVP